MYNSNNLSKLDIEKIMEKCRKPGDIDRCSSKHLETVVASTTIMKPEVRREKEKVHHQLQIEINLLDEICNASIQG